MNDLVLIPLVLAGYARYIKGIDDEGKAFEPSPDPLLAELSAIVAPLEVKEGPQDFSCLKPCTPARTSLASTCMRQAWARRSRACCRAVRRPRAVRKTLHKYVSAR